MLYIYWIFKDGVRNNVVNEFFRQARKNAAVIFDLINKLNDK